MEKVQHISKSAIYWVGAIAMVASAWILPDPRGFMVAIIGLAILTVQAWEHRVFQFVALNVFSILGFTYNLWNL